MDTAHPTSPGHIAPTSGYAVDCHACEQFGPPLASTAEADQLAAIHDHLHHQGHPTAHITTTA